MRLRDKQEPDYKRSCKTMSRSVGFILRAIGSQKGVKARKWHDDMCVLVLPLWCKCGD